ncbi:MAG TPA: NAD(P)H-binding protein [Candidatus Limnocylindrales bacterium]|nr:NAD(P)H-binding protein [Candidatus Limnocylindrales bacterium]
MSTSGPNRQRVLVTGGGTLLGDAVAAALLAEGADVTLLMRPGAENRLGALGLRVREVSADVWEPSSLKGHARGMSAVIHTVGGMTADPAHGLSFSYLNIVSARNVANMAVNGGAARMVLLSAVAAPWAPRGYVRAKREAEQYLERIGLRATIIRAPVVFVRGSKRRLFYRAFSALGNFPLTGWLGFRALAPLPLDVVARGIARITLAPRTEKLIYGAKDLRNHNSARELRRGMTGDGRTLGDAMLPASTIQLLDDEIPFGWTPRERY